MPTRNIPTRAPPYRTGTMANTRRFCLPSQGFAGTDGEGKKSGYFEHDGMTKGAQHSMGLVGGWLRLSGILWIGEDRCCHHKRFQTPRRRSNPVGCHEAIYEVAAFTCLETLVNGNLKTESRQPDDEYRQRGDIRRGAVSTRQPPTDEKYQFTQHQRQDDNGNPQGIPAMVANEFIRWNAMEARIDDQLNQPDEDHQPPAYGQIGKISA